MNAVSNLEAELRAAQERVEDLILEVDEGKPAAAARLAKAEAAVASLSSMIDRQQKLEAARHRQIEAADRLRRDGDRKDFLRRTDALIDAMAANLRPLLGTIAHAQEQLRALEPILSELHRMTPGSGTGMKGRLLLEHIAAHVAAIFPPNVELPRERHPYGLPGGHDLAGHTAREMRAEVARYLSNLETA